MTPTEPFRDVVGPCVHCKRIIYHGEPVWYALYQVWYQLDRTGHPKRMTFKPRPEGVFACRECGPGGMSQVLLGGGA